MSSDGMLLSSVLLTLVVLHVCHCYVEQYRGFDNCGVGGWHCETTGLDYIVTYQCRSSDKNARLWAWTARIPSVTTILAVTGCDHVEIHLDCTMGYRSYTMKELRVTNVKHLEFLKPLAPYVFLHDNDEFTHAPPSIAFTNVSKLTWTPGLFDKAGGRCRTKQQVLEEIHFENVDIPAMATNLFRNQSLKSLTWVNVKVGSLAPKSMHIITEKFSIVNSTLPVIPSQAFYVQSDTVTLTGNNIKEVGAQSSLTVRSDSFQMSGNNIGEVGSGGFNLMARHISFTNNTWELLKADALSLVSPGEKPNSNFKIATKFTYKFNNNNIVKLEQNGLHPDYDTYKGVCTSMEFEHNVIPCSCNIPKEGSERVWWTKSMAEFVSTETNKCRGTPECPLRLVIDQISHTNCTNFVQPTSCHLDFESTTEYEVATTVITTTTTTTTTTAPTTKIPIVIPSTQADAHTLSTSAGTIAIVVVVTVVIMLITAGLGYLMYKKKRDNDLKNMTSYRPEVNLPPADEDDQVNLITDRAAAPLSVKYIAS